MLTKHSIVAALGESELALPALVEAGLAANDRAKYRLTLLQSARRHAEAPDAPPPPLAAERAVAGLDDAALDRLPAACERLPDGRYRLPGLGKLLGDLGADLDAMLAPVRATGDGDERALLEARAAVLLATLRAPDDTFSAADVDAWTHADRGRGDGVHRLVMDLHKALNRLQASLATEFLDGAAVHGLGEADRPLVRAFVRGVARTSPLRFDHPGLGTTAARHGERLVLQNDIGTTDAHVLVVHVDEDAVSVTYTDVHLQRLLFFQALFDGRGVEWHDTRLVQDRRMEDGLYHVAVGRRPVAGPGDAAAFLEFLGSRLVFLIDWNRARKQLRQLVGKRAALDALAWGATHDVGHMAFLRVGGARAVFDALDFVARGRGRYGQTLEDVLGAERAASFLQFALKSAATELLAARGDTRVVDEWRAELARHVRGSAESVLDGACEHAGLIVEIASAVRDALHATLREAPADAVVALAARCKAWESDADRLVVAARVAVAAAPETAWLRDYVERADDVADQLEETAFLVTLLRPAGVLAGLRTRLAALAGEVVGGAQELVKALEVLRTLGPGATREDLGDFLDAIHRIGRVEHATDALMRALTAEIAAQEASARQVHVTTQSAAALERAADRLLHAALGLRDRALERLTRH